MQAPDASRLTGPAGRFLTLPSLVRSTALGLTLGLLLTACGGGSGGSTLAATSPSTGVETPADLGSDGKPREVRCAR
ncbi:hypothetical protein [Variovorax sp. HJSM1_2]|uniref:hypothetical protein n=1 Tax=Variovorax sp. HJSM1_2 TaxID=3366263 RepID=UPI003BE9DD02